MDKISWPSISTFSNWILDTADTKPKATIRSKIKIHGTNSSIIFANGQKPIAMKRKGQCKDDADNHGFKKWVKSCFKSEVKNTSPITIFGEWAGEGIHSHDVDAITKLDFRAFFVFSVWANDQWHIDPAVIKKFISALSPCSDENLFVLPWFDEPQNLNLLDNVSLRSFADIERDKVDQIGTQCPFMESKFCLTGPGEGLVFYDLQTNLPVFKIKTAQHVERVSQKISEPIHVPVFNNVKNFAEEFFTDRRMLQIVDKHCNGEISRKTSGRFIKEIIDDVFRECQNELKISDVEFKDVRAYGTKISRDWFSKNSGRSRST